MFVLDVGVPSTGVPDSPLDYNTRSSAPEGDNFDLVALVMHNQPLLQLLLHKVQAIDSEIIEHLPPMIRNLCHKKITN